MIDCHDGRIVAYATGFSPNAELANGMLVKAAETLPEGARPLCVCSIEVRPMRHNFPVRKSGRN